MNRLDVYHKKESASMDTHISITNIPKISAIYFALLQCGYNYYAVEKDIVLLKTLEKFRLKRSTFEQPFFSEVKQNTCEVYPYWPRAALLETATFFLDKTNGRFENFGAYHMNVMSANNISAAERDGVFWGWIREFPTALCTILTSEVFQSYLHWENEWIEQQNEFFKNDLLDVHNVISACANNYNSPIQNVSVILNPIKCAHSADYHITENHLFFCAGAFRKESVVHEFLHHTIHPFITKYKEIILQQSVNYLNIDPSYYLDGDEHGRLNAFEEYLVRKLTSLASTDKLPFDIGSYINEIITI